MYRTARASIVSIMLLTGCSVDLESVQLDPGDLVVVSRDGGCPLFKSYISKISPQLAQGVQLRVGFDPGIYQETQQDLNEVTKGIDDFDKKRRAAGPRRYEASDLMSKYRTIKITVETGAHAGATGEVLRADVTPVAK